MSKARELAELGAVYNSGALSNRNLIINGAMQVAQRGTSFASLATSQYTLDRWYPKESGSVVFTVTKEADGPDGFASSLKINVDTANASLSAGDFFTLEHLFEGQNLQALKKGTANAQPVTLSFWVKSNVTGTFICEFDDNDNARNINKSYTVNSSGTWEYKTITFEGDTSGTFDNDHANSARIIWWLDAGSNFRGGTLATSWESTNNVDRVEGGVTFADTVNNYFQITGVQLEVGSEATPFEHRSYGDELARCQRYYYKTGEIGTSQEWFPGVTTYAAYGNVSAIAINDNDDRAFPTLRYPVTMRASPSVTFYPGRSALAATANRINPYNGDTSVTFSGSPTARVQGLAGYFSGTSTDSPVYTFQVVADAEL